MSSAEKPKTMADILADFRQYVVNTNLMPEVIEAIVCYLNRIEAAAERERESSEDKTLVKSCYTCKHFQHKRKWCRVHDYSPHDPSTLPLIWPNGPCPQWECKYNSHGGVTK